MWGDNMKLIVGLGNPGIEYNNTRHNIGFMVIDRLLERYNHDKLKDKFGGLYTEVVIDNEKVMLLKPQKYINLSGEVIKKFVDYYKVDINDIIIINDDLDLEIGNFKLKPTGSSAGHNGLKNIELMLGTQDYKRLKIGISNNKNIDTKDYVLGKISKEEKEKIDEVIDISMNIIDDYIKLSFTELMSKYNRKQ